MLPRIHKVLVFTFALAFLSAELLAFPIQLVREPISTQLAILHQDQSSDSGHLRLTVGSLHLSPKPIDALMLKRLRLKYGEENVFVSHDARSVFSITEVHTEPEIREIAEGSQPKIRFAPDGKNLLLTIPEEKRVLSLRLGLSKRDREKNHQMDSIPMEDSPREILNHGVILTSEGFGVLEFSGGPLVSMAHPNLRHTHDFRTTEQAMLAGAAYGNSIFVLKEPDALTVARGRLRFFRDKMSRGENYFLDVLLKQSPQTLLTDGDRLVVLVERKDEDTMLTRVSPFPQIPWPSLPGHYKDNAIALSASHHVYAAREGVLKVLQPVGGKINTVNLPDGNFDRIRANAMVVMVVDQENGFAFPGKVIQGQAKFFDGNLLPLPANIIDFDLAGSLQ